MSKNNGVKLQVVAERHKQFKRPLCSTAADVTVKVCRRCHVASLPPPKLLSATLFIRFAARALLSEALRLQVAPHSGFPALVMLEVM